VSVLVVVIVVAGARARVFVFRFVEDWIADYVFFARPIAEVEEAAAFAAERKIGVRFGVGWFVAVGTAVLHGFYSKANMNGFQWEFDAARGIESKEPAGRPSCRSKLFDPRGKPALRKCSGAVRCGEAWIACAEIEGKAHDEDGDVLLP
jgi:hypothetical protein